MNRTARQKKHEETNKLEKRRKRSEYIYLLDVFAHEETHESRKKRSHYALGLSRGQPFCSPACPE